MARTYSEFKAHVTATLWRANDTALANSLDDLIGQANDELDKLTANFQRREVTVTLAPESQDYDLTTNVPDFKSVISLVNNQSGIYRDTGPKFNMTLPSHIYRLRAKQVTPSLQPYYAVERDSDTLYLRLVGPFSATDPGDLELSYHAGVPDYATADSSWLEEDYFNLYLYTVYKHCAIFLREDERIQMYADLQKAALEDADTDDKFNKQFGGSPLHMQPTRKVP